MRQKVKVIEVEAVKLDPKATHLVVFNLYLMSSESAREVMSELHAKGHKRSVGLMCEGPPDQAIKVYEIPKETKQ